MSTVCIYPGSFDPFHKGHQEVANVALEYAKLVVILPNKPNKNKPNRSGIIYRSHLLSKIYHLYNDNSYFSNTGIVVDTRNIDIVISELKKKFKEVLSVVGSDIIKNPKFDVNKCIINERDFYPIKNNKLFDDLSYAIIPSGKLQYQFVSSTYIRNNRDLSEDLVPPEIVQFLMKEPIHSLTSLSCKTLKHEIIDDTFIKTFCDNETALCYVNNCNKFTKIIGNPFITTQIVKHGGNEVHEKYIKNIGTILDVINRDDIDEILGCFFQKLSTLHTITDIIHGDVGAGNVLLINHDNNDYIFGLIDYEKCKNGRGLDKLREFFQFIFSFKFYGLRNGTKYDINKIMMIGKQNYTNIQNYTPNEVISQFNYWNDMPQNLV